MNRQESEVSTDMSGGGKKKRKKYVFLDKYEEFKSKTETNLRALYLLHILQILTLIATYMYK